MSKGLIIGLGIVGAFFAMILIVVMMFISANNQGVRMEEDIKAAYKNNQNILSNFSKKVVETAQVPEMYVDDLTKVTKATMSGRYGADGSKAVFQMLKETNIPMDSKLYTQIQQVIEAGRNDFQTGQTSLIDKVRIERTALGTMPKGLIMSFMGFPKIDLSQYDIVIDDRTATAFDSKREEAIKLRK